MSRGRCGYCSRNRCSLFRGSYLHVRFCEDTLGAGFAPERIRDT